MPRSFLFTREEVVAAALELAAEGGLSAVTARALGTRLGASSKPIFGLFANMEEVQAEVIRAAGERFQAYLRADMESGRYPPYKASGMAYIRFARERRELFKMLFMCDRNGQSVPQTFDDVQPVIDALRRGTGLSVADARMFHLEMWLYVHGIASMVATSFSEWDEALISRVLTDGYEGLKYRYLDGSEKRGSDSH